MHIFATTCGLCVHCVHHVWYMLCIMLDVHSECVVSVKCALRLLSVRNTWLEHCDVIWRDKTPSQVMDFVSIFLKHHEFFIDHEHIVFRVGW